MVNLFSFRVAVFLKIGNTLNLDLEPMSSYKNSNTHEHPNNNFITQTTILPTTTTQTTTLTMMMTTLQQQFTRTSNKQIDKMLSRFRRKKTTKDYIGYEPILAPQNYYQIFRRKLE